MNGPPGASRILVVDDESQLQRALKSILSLRHYEVDVAGSGREALEKAVRNPPDLVVLDLFMPEMSGLEVCRELRTWLAAPILVLSVHSGVEEKIAALDLGADDYLIKPFAAGELLARVRALLRRSSSLPPSEPTIYVGDLEIDIARRSVTCGGQDVKLTRTEFDILSFLAQKAGCVVTSRMLLEALRGAAYSSDNQTLRVHIGHLRKKIEPHPAVPRYIITEPGVGYRLSTS